MASVNIEPRVSKKTGKTTYRVKVRITYKGRILDEKNETFDNKRLAKLWGEKTRIELDKQLQELKAGIKTENTEDLKEMKIGHLIEHYLLDEHIQQSLGRTKRYVLNALMHYKISTIYASRLTAQDLIEHCKFRLNEETHPTPQTVYQDVTYLRSVMKVAKPLFGVNANLSYHDEAIPTLVKYKLIGRSKARDTRPTENELELMREGLKRRQYHRAAHIPYLDILDISLLTAMRLGEITKIEWKDFDPKKKTLLIRNRKAPSGKEGNNSLIPLIGDAVDIIARQPKSNEKPKQHLIFPYNPRSISAGWQRVRAELGLSNIRYHDLRREAASRLAEKGVPINIVAKITGHKNINILHNIYSKFDIENFDINNFEPVITKNQS
ncbi:site-specific integrase [Vibrio parahaemolyticus]|nr:site-specific integrase [Vibrio parahaemolyticus]